MRDSETTTPTQRGQAGSHSVRPAEETARLGKEIYERDIRRLVETATGGRLSPSTWTPEAMHSARTPLSPLKACGINARTPRSG